ncbi:MAG TPA: phage Gp37/Gp68 family protein [Gemmataceae bacterium]|nr:phage Gp37/Gp68 family protein [Gemmataceae bacterium]
MAAPESPHLSHRVGLRYKAHPYERGFDPRLVPEKLAEPLRWATPRMIFVNSMSDLFHEDVPDDYILQVTEVMRVAGWHTFQVLTKRAERMLALLQSKLRGASGLRHIWWGVSVENKRHGLPRVDLLRKAPAAVRFLSIEPLLEDLGDIALDGIHWVIVGGESGFRARSMDEAWALSIRNQCRTAKVPFFFKQWGGCHKGQAGRLLDGTTYSEMPERVPQPAPPSNRRRELIQRINAPAVVE